MSDSSQSQNLPDKVIELVVDSIFRKNGINIDQVKGKVSEEQRQMLKELVNDLTKKVDTFVNTNDNDSNKNS